MRSTENRARGRSLRALITTLALAAFVVALLAGAALAADQRAVGRSATPGKAKARAPEGRDASAA